MTLEFDHLVHFLHRPPSDALELLSQAGYHAVAGGRHAAWGTRNSLSYFGLSYVEFLSVEVESVARASDNPLIGQVVADIDRGEGFSQIALRTTQMDEWADRLRKQGMCVIGPVQGSRTRDDGTVIRWRMLFLEDEKAELQPPFLIEWQQSDAERKNDLTLRGILAPHPNGASALDSVGYAVKDLGKAVQAWQRWFQAESGAAYRDEQLGATSQTIELTGGDIVLCQPDGEGMAQSALASRGERPFFARFAGASEERQDVILGGVYMTRR